MALGVLRRPGYRQIADQLRQAIREGRYGEGDAVPRESALAKTDGVTRMTARQAVDVLKNEGLVSSEHGRERRRGRATIRMGLVRSLQPGRARRAAGPTARLVRSREACSARRVAGGRPRSARALGTGRIRKLGCSTQVGT